MSGNTLAWQLEAVLPNLQPDAAFEFSSLVIVPNSDSRLDAIRSRNKAARALLDGFSDQRGTALKPAAVIFHVANPFRDRWRAILDARNMLAVACALNGWQHTIGHPNSFIIRYTDYFDFYPRRPSENGRDLCYQGAALGLVSIIGKHFVGQPHAYIRSSGGLPSRIQPDEDLFRSLSRVWMRSHVSNKAQVQDHRLMRSLSLAYEAGRVPQSMDYPLYDHGKHTAFWISAFETLTHPRSGWVGRDSVLTLLAKRHIEDRRVAQRRVIRCGKKKRALNLVQRLCVRLYDARNAFLHGNNLPMSKFIPKGLAEGIRILDVAPLVYLAALEGYLGLHAQTHSTYDEPGKRLATIIRRMASCEALEDGFARAMHWHSPVSMSMPSKRS